MTTMGELCNRTVWIADPRESVVDAARRMRDHHVGCLVVVEDRDGGRAPIGLVTDRDLVVNVLATRSRSVTRPIGARPPSRSSTTTRQPTW